MNEVVSSGDVIDGLKEKVGELIYENSILRAQVIALKRHISDLESRSKDEGE